MPVKVRFWLGKAIIQNTGYTIHGTVISPGLMEMPRTNPSMVRFQKEVMREAIQAGRLRVDHFDVGQLNKDPRAKCVLDLSHRISVFH